MNGCRVSGCECVICFLFLLLLSTVDNVGCLAADVAEPGINVRLSLEQDRAEETAIQELSPLQDKCQYTYFN